MNSECYETHQGIARLANPAIAYAPVSLREDYLTRMAQANLLSSNPQSLREFPQLDLSQLNLGSGANSTGYLSVGEQNYCSGCH